MSVSLTEVSNGAWRLPCLELAAVLGNGKWFNSRWVLCPLSVRPAEEKLPGATLRFWQALPLSSME